MFHLVYVSAAVAPLHHEELRELLRKSRSKNQGLGITGMLLYRDGNFMQLLEGEEAAVRALFAVIRADPRHRGIIVIVEESTDSLLFGEWSMAFRDLADPSLESLPGYSRFMNQRLDAENFSDEPDACWKLLDFFRLGR